MITFLNKQQLAFILDIKAVDARKKMIYAWCSFKKIEPDVSFKESEKGTIKMIENGKYPEAMEIRLLSEYLGIPTLQQSVNDIHDNYLKRPATKKWILSDFPEKELLKNQRGRQKSRNYQSRLR